MAKKKRRTLLRPPPGSYDPALDAQERAANRGLGDLVLDTEKSGSRSLTDYLLGQGDLTRQRGEFGEDVAGQRAGLESSYGRSLSDLLTERTQAGEDYTRNLAQLQRNYDRLGSAQAGQQRKAGVSAGGAGAQAARKRSENQAWERAPIDTGFGRFNEASKLAETRLGEDKATSLANILQAERRGYGDLDRAGGTANLNYQRGTEDLTSQLARAKVENTFYGQDIAAARQAQYGGPITLQKKKKARAQARAATKAVA